MHPFPVLHAIAPVVMVVIIVVIIPFAVAHAIVGKRFVTIFFIAVADTVLYVGEIPEFASHVMVSPAFTYTLDVFCIFPHTFEEFIYKHVFVFGIGVIAQIAANGIEINIA